MRDFPLTEIHPSALIAAQAGHCAAAQGQFWPMYERLFATHDSEWGGYEPRDRTTMVDFAKALGLDDGAFSACFNDPATAAAVLAERAAAEQLGVNSTPTFLINGTLVRGALPFRTFSEIIRRAAGG